MNRKKLLGDIVRSLFTGLFVLFAFALVYGFHNKLAAASLAASAFIVFGFTKAESARARYLLGGYGCALVMGFLVNRLLLAFGPDDLRRTVLFCSLAVMLTAFAMFSLRLQHPPAAAMAISMVTESQPIEVGLMVFACIALLCALRFRLEGWFDKHFE